MATLFDLLHNPNGNSPYYFDQTNLTENQLVKLHQARSLCSLLTHIADVSADFTITHQISMDALGGTAWLLRDTIDAIGKPELNEDNKND